MGTALNLRFWLLPAATTMLPALRLVIDGNSPKTSVPLGHLQKHRGSPRRKNVFEGFVRVCVCVFVCLWLCVCALVRACMRVRAKARHVPLTTRKSPASAIWGASRNHAPSNELLAPTDPRVEHQDHCFKS